MRTHRAAFGDDPVLANALDVGGEYAFRVRGEEHMWTPETIAKLQHATRTGKFETYKEYARLINDQTKRHMTLRGLFEFKPAGPPVPLDEVEPAKEIVKRFATGAMSLGSISTEAHTTLAIAMNRIGGKSNTGEGGEDPRASRSLKGGETLAGLIGKSRIERDIPLAGRRFAALANQAGGLRPLRRHRRVSGQRRPDPDQDGAGRQARRGRPAARPQGLRVHRASCAISVPGVGLISPPPHHDIYSIEDLAQLIHDLKNANPKASIRVKLVSEVGVGTVAAGVAKAKADHVTISGYDGGTGASPAVLDQARRHALGTGPGRDAADAGAEPPARPHRRAGRRPDEDRPRRDDRRAARRRRVRLRHRAAGRRGLHHDAQVPPQHLPGRRRHAGSGAAQEVHRPARACGQLLLLRRRGSARADGAAGHPQVRRPDRPHRPARHAAGHRSLEGARASISRASSTSRRCRPRWRATTARRRTTASTRRSTTS